MPVSLGDGPLHDFDRPIDLMMDCHRRIEDFLAMLIAVAQQARGGPLNDEQRAAQIAALDYFQQAAPRHTADEEQSLFPRLRAKGTPEARTVLAEVEALERDHRDAERAHAEVDALGRRWLALDRLSPDDLARYRDLLATLGDTYAAHIRAEDQSVFPAAARLMTDEDLRSMGEEMRARRAIKTRGHDDG